MAEMAVGFDFIQSFFYLKFRFFSLRFIPLIILWHRINLVEHSYLIILIVCYIIQYLQAHLLGVKRENGNNPTLRKKYVLKSYPARTNDLNIPSPNFLLFRQT